MQQMYAEPNRMTKTMVVLPASLVSQLDELARSQELLHGRSHLIRRAVKRFLKEEMAEQGGIPVSAR